MKINKHDRLIPAHRLGHSNNKIIQDICYIEKELNILMDLNNIKARVLELKSSLVVLKSEMILRAMTEGKPC